MYIGQTVGRGGGGGLYDREHRRDMRLAHFFFLNETSPISGEANEPTRWLIWDKVKFIDGDPHNYTLSVKDFIQVM